MEYIELKINLPKSISEDFTTLLDEMGVDGYYEVLFDFTIPKNTNEIIRDDTTINVYLLQDEIDKELRIYIYLKSICSDSHFIERRLVNNEEFELAYKEHYKPFKIGNQFYIIPSWEKENQEIQDFIQKENLRPLYLNPGLAFGTGQHETTQLMLSKMESVVQKGNRILDMGTGSGVLSIGASILGANYVFAVDIDRNSINAIEYNLSMNDISAKVDFQLGSFDLEELQTLSFDAMLCNITYGIISQNYKHILKLNTNRILFSGIIVEKQKDFLHDLDELFFGTVLDVQELKGWIIVDWKKKEK